MSITFKETTKYNVYCIYDKKSLEQICPSMIFKKLVHRLVIESMFNVKLKQNYTSNGPYSQEN